METEQISGAGQEPDGRGLEPIPETLRAANELDALSTDDDLLDQLRRAGHAVQQVVPTCCGLSLALLEHGVTLTLVASDEDTVVLDAVQYLDGGPCVDSTRGHEVVIGEVGALDEREWHLFAATSAAHGVASTLSLPVLDDGTVVGSINLYASTAHAFDGHHEAQAAILGAWAEGAITNADLTFSTRLAAQEAPQVLHDARRVDVAVGILAARERTSTAEAHRRLREAVAAAGVPVVMVPETVITFLGERRK